MSEHQTTSKKLVEVYKRTNNESDFVAVVIFEGICFDPAKSGDEQTASEMWSLIDAAWHAAK